MTVIGIRYQALGIRETRIMTDSVGSGIGYWALGIGKYIYLCLRAFVSKKVFGIRYQALGIRKIGVMTDGLCSVISQWSMVIGKNSLCLCALVAKLVLGIRHWALGIREAVVMTDRPRCVISRWSMVIGKISLCLRAFVAKKTTATSHRSPRNSYFAARTFIIVFFCCFAIRADAQEIKINSGFLSDSLKIGEETAFYLAAHYRSDINILFPDSTHAFVPFEYTKRNYFPTKTTGGTSVDSAVYYLTTFEVERIQKLNLPVYIVQARDCTVVQSSIDSVLITQLVAKVPDSLSIDKLPLKMNTAYQKVFFQFNFWVVLIAVGVLIVIAIVVWIFFGKRIRQYLLERRMKKKHAQFLNAYTNIVQQLQSTFSAITTENAVSLWKKYMEQLESRPYTKLTTKETQDIIHDDHLMQNLRVIDTAIYGHNTSVYDSLNFLKNFADQRFSKKIEELNHGK